VGPLIYAAGMLLFLRLQPGSNLWLEVVPAVLVIGLGMVITVAPLTGTVMGSVPPENAGSASAVNNVVSRVAGLLAIAGLGVVMSAVFTGQVAEQTQKLDAATAASLHNAAKDPSSALNNLTGGFSPTVINAIKEAYTPAFHWVIIVCALMAALGGLISFIMIRRSANQSNIGAKEKNQPAA
ncbi:MAG TPA: hypothetical protein VH186_34835, partial [Chloroflexia bacterium]|nr:hypothetical protein [Chloroflexia bacterium]